MSAAVKEIRSVSRAVSVIDALCRLDGCGLADLHHATGLPKSTLRRILKTFECGGFVRCSLADGLYRANIGVPTYAETVDNPLIGQVVAAATPILEELSRKVPWPSDVLVRRGMRMKVVESNRSMTPLMVNQLEIGDQVDMLQSAVGRAYLAFCSEAERKEILSETCSTLSADQLMHIDSVLAVTRQRGYAERDTASTGGTNRFPLLADKLFAVAVPAVTRDHVICCINLLRPASAKVSADEARSLVSLLKSCASRIVNNYTAGRTAGLPARRANTTEAGLVGGDGLEPPTSCV